MKLLQLIFLFLVLNLLRCKAHNHVDITLVGGYGDLAKKYLWHAFFKLYVKHLMKNDLTFNVFGAGPKNVTIGGKKLLDALKTGVRCTGTKDFNCQEFSDDFVKKIHYIQLKNEQDYSKHCLSLAASSIENHCHKGHSCEYQSIFYLSVPPFAYKNISNFIASHCRPAEGTGTLKVVIEKPFGHNKASVIDLANFVEKFLLSREIYRVDHYLGKQTVQEILPFRAINPKINAMLNNQFVERIEIIMKELVDAKGRTSYFDKYGVIADVMQNHLSEILYLLIMDLPTNFTSSDEINRSKIKTIRSISSISPQNLVVGQYKGVKLEANSSRMKDVPIILLAGKKLEERTSYARILFKDKVFAVNTNHKCSQRSEVVFHIGYGPLGRPAILVSRNLPINTTYIPHNWQETTEFQNLHYFGQNLTCFKVFTPNVTYDAYEFLVEQVFLGHQEHFITSPALIESWKIWDYVITNSGAAMQLYPGGNAIENLLDFQFDSNEMAYTHPTWDSNKEKKFLGNSVIIGTVADISKTLAEEIASAIQTAAESKKNFHLAVSSGSSPLPLFEALVAISETIPWHIVHVWQVDERCTMDSTLSNLNTLSSAFIDNIHGLKFRNIHSMPVETSPQALCSEAGAGLYEKWLRLHVGTSPKLDFVVLGVGMDGHTASLFPFHEVLNETKRLVAIADDVDATVQKRMTMTYPLIQMAKNVAVLVPGAEKCNLLQTLDESECDDHKKFPICKVSSLSDRVTWFINNRCDFT